MENLCEEVSSKFKISDLFLKIILRTMRNRTLFPGYKNLDNREKFVHIYCSVFLHQALFNCYTLLEKTVPRSF